MPIADKKLYQMKKRAVEIYIMVFLFVRELFVFISLRLLLCVFVVKYWLILE